jgi:L-lysine 2,3-aminomutase
MEAEQIAPVAGGRGFRAYSSGQLDGLLARAGLEATERLALRAIATVVPFRANDYVIEHLIDWAAAPDDPIYRLFFPHPGMLPAGDVDAIARLLAAGTPETAIREAAHAVRLRVHPDPPGQPAPGQPQPGSEPVPGLRREHTGTVLVFPRHAQASHADGMDTVTGYLRSCPEVTNVVIAGADPMIMDAAALRRCLLPLLDPALEHIESVTIETRSLGCWPQRFVSDPDADDTLRLAEQVTAAGKTLALMARFSHPRELEPPLTATAAGRLRAAGAVIRTRAPLTRTVNDQPQAWAAMWRAQVRLGMVPYDMVIEPDTGPQGYFAVPIANGAAIFQAAFSHVSGLCRTVHGPVMATTSGTVCVEGAAQIAGQKVFVLHSHQTSDPALTGQRFFARYDPGAVWLSDLEPAFASRFPFDPPVAAR